VDGVSFSGAAVSDISSTTAGAAALNTLEAQTTAEIDASKVTTLTGPVADMSTVISTEVNSATASVSVSHESVIAGSTAQLTAALATIDTGVFATVAADPIANLWEAVSNAPVDAGQLTSFVEVPGVLFNALDQNNFIA
jgi:hypothetical protein